LDAPVLARIRFWVEARLQLVVRYLDLSATLPVNPWIIWTAEMLSLFGLLSFLLTTGALRGFSMVNAQAETDFPCTKVGVSLGAVLAKSASGIL